MYYIADLYVDLKVDGRTYRNAEQYFCDTNKTPQIIVEKDYEQALLEYPQFVNYKYPEGYEQYVYEGLNYMHERDTFARKILDYNGIVLHSSSVVVDGKAYLFSAPSGTGKSTHTKLWLEKFGDKAFILNDDKPAIRILDDGIYAYGTPWCGSSNISTNAKAKLQGICFLKRDESNWIKRMDIKEASIRMLHGCAIPLKLNNIEVLQEIDIINKLIRTIPIYEMGCTPTEQAVDVAYNIMSEENI